MNEKQKISPAGKWGSRPLYLAKVGTHSTELLLIKGVRNFSVGQYVTFVRRSELEGMSVGMAPNNWKSGRIWRIESGYLFINLV